MSTGASHLSTHLDLFHEKHELSLQIQEYRRHFPGSVLGRFPVPGGLCPDVAGVGHGAVRVVVATRGPAIGPLGAPTAE